jgi:hypothetical protein
VSTILPRYAFRACGKDLYLSAVVETHTRNYFGCNISGNALFWQKRNGKTAWRPCDVQRQNAAIDVLCGWLQVAAFSGTDLALKSALLLLCPLLGHDQ